MVNIFLAFVLLRFFFRKDLQNCVIKYSEEPIKDKRLALLSKSSLALILVLVAAKVATVFLGVQLDFRLTYIAVIPAAIILTLSPRRVELLKKVDWRTLVFFVAMFILMESVWESGFFQSVVTGSQIDITSAVAILPVSTIVSQLISNVPLVALYLPMLTDAGASIKALMALAAGSTIAGNLFILGAASNVIIIQNAEKKFGETITFLDFAKIGVLLTTINLFVYWLSLTVL